MQMSATTTWWLTFALFALQGATSIGWSAFGLDQHAVAIIAQVIGYLTLLLNFAVHGSIPGVPPVNMTGLPPPQQGRGTSALVWLAIGLLPLMLALGTVSAHAQSPIVKKVQRDLGLQPTQPTAADNEGPLAKALIKPFQDLANFIGGDIDGAIALSTAIPSLQDGHGQQCLIALKVFGQVVKAHPVPLTFKVATDLEALRLAQMAANNLCGNPHCTQVFGDLATTVQTAAPVNVSIPIPSLHDLCAKVPMIAVVAPVPDPTPATPATPAPTIPAIPATPSSPAPNNP